MPRLPRINIKLAVAAICFIAGIIILWRTFSVVRPAQVATEPTSVVAQAPTKRANAELVGVTPPVEPTSLQNPIIQATPTASLVPSVTPVSPTAILPTAVLANPSPNIVVSPSLVVVPSPDSAVPPTATIAALPSSLVTTIVPSQGPSETVLSTTSTVAPTTAVPTTAVVANATDTVTPTPTSTPTTVQPTPSVVTVTYRVDGTVSSAYIGYTDVNGKIVDIVVGLPWSMTLQTAADADLYVDVVASLPNEQDNIISCAILINGASVFDGKPLPFDQDSSTNGGVTCDRSLS